MRADFSKGYLAALKAVIAAYGLPIEVVEMWPE